MLVIKRQELMELQEEKLDLENLSLAAATAYTKLEQMADDAKNARHTFACDAAPRSRNPLKCARPLRET